MKIAVTGKGGAGKSTVAGALIRHLARMGNKVVALDADPNPNLAVSLGVGREAAESMKPILNALLEIGHTHHDPQPRAEELVARYGITTADGVILVATGRIERPSEACLCCGSHNMTRQLFGELPDHDRIVVVDLEAGLNDLVWAQPTPDDIVLAVTEGSLKSVEIARRACHLANEMGVRRVVGVANRVAPGADLRGLIDELGLEVVLAVPEDGAVLEARKGNSAFDAHPDSPAMLAIGDLARHLAGC